METLIIMMKVGKSMSIRISSREAKLAEGNVTTIEFNLLIAGATFKKIIEQVTDVSEDHLNEKIHSLETENCKEKKVLAVNRRRIVRKEDSSRNKKFERIHILHSNAPILGFGYRPFVKIFQPHESCYWQIMIYIFIFFFIAV